MSKFNRFVDFYIDGFTHLPDWARTLWIIILAKLFVMFVVLKLFFFQADMKVNFNNDQDRANHVIEKITNP
jgi:Na+/H+ antiporter NhaD/arsenite permease-like protein